MVQLAYAIITLGSSTLWGVISGWLLYFYLPPGTQPLVSPALYSIVILISKAVNIFFGLPIGYISDNTESSWGRRLPYVIGGAIALPILFVLLWTPPHARGSNITLLYLFLISVAFNTAYEIHQVPYEALLPELAVSEKQRVTISSWKTGFVLVGNIFAGFTGPLINSMGYIHAMWIFAVIAAPAMILPGLFLRRRINLNIKPTQKIPFFESLKITFDNRDFQIFSLSWSLLWIGSTFVLTILPFIVTEVCGLNAADTVYFYLPAIAVTLLAFPFVIRLSDRYGMKITYRGSVLAGAIAFPTLMLIGDWIPIPLLAQGILWIVIQSASLAGTQILPSAMVAQITDQDEMVTGHRREGSFYSVWGLLNQISSGLGMTIIPLVLLLGRSRSDPNGPLGVRLLGLLGGVLLLISYFAYQQPEQSAQEHKHA